MLFFLPSYLFQSTIERMETIVCPHCNKEVELSEALFHEVKEKVSQELKLTQAKELEKIRTETSEKVRAEVEKSQEFTIKNKEKENEELKTKNDKLYAELLDLNKTLRELKEQERSSRLENEKKINETLEKFQTEFEQRAKLEKLELEKKLSDTQKALEEAQRKSKQGSAQLQGEVLELDLETQLRTTFPEDIIKDVPKGITGADVLQIVRNKQGKEAGSIIWEAKRAKWNQNWIQKLKDDMRTAGSSEAVLVVEDLPEKIRSSGLVSGVWVTSYKDILTVASTLRLLLMKVAAAKSAAENKDERLEELYHYITSDSFRHRIESQIESFIQMKNDLDSERRSMERLWAKREIQLMRLEKNTTNIFGELQGIAGEGLPSIKSLEAGQEEEQENLFAENLKED